VHVHLVLLLQVRITIYSNDMHLSRVYKVMCAGSRVYKVMILIIEFYFI
jgi:hypothetical protein